MSLCVDGGRFLMGLDYHSTCAPRSTSPNPTPNQSHPVPPQGRDLAIDDIDGLELTHNSGVWVNVSKGSGLDQPAPVCHSMLMAGPDQWPAVSQKNNSTTEPVDRQTDRRWPLTEPELSPALLIKQTLVWSDYLPRWVYSLQWEVGAH